MDKTLVKTAKGLVSLAKQLETVDQAEAVHETQMSKANLRDICEMAEGIEDLLTTDEELDAWVSDKITTCFSHLQSVFRYLKNRDLYDCDEECEEDADETIPEDSPSSVDAPKIKILSASYDHINFKPPTGVAKSAARGLALRKKFKRGGTGVGVARARDLKNRKDMSPRTIRRMVSFFARHEVDKKGENWGKSSDPSRGYIAWLLWGGDAGRAWCNKVSRQMDSADDKS